MTKILLINGPPRSGKDTLANMILGHDPSKIVRIGFADALKEATHKFYAVMSDIAFIPRINAFEHTKDTPNSFFLGLTPRLAYINVSEKLMKPAHGDGIFGDLLVEKIKRRKEDIIVVPDSGFVSEVKRLVEQFGEENIGLIRVHREGKTFEGDSRSYIYDVVPSQTDVYNNQDIGALRDIAHDTLNNFLKHWA